MSEPDISEIYKRAIERALRWAWSEARRRWARTLRTGREEEITQKLQLLLNLHTRKNRRVAPGLGSFETVARGAKVEAADGRIELMPDLVFRPPQLRGVRNRSEWGYFVECKIVDGTASVRAYCKNGVARFSDGVYCARMPSAAMVGYVRDSSRPFASLDPYFDGAYGTASHLERGVDGSASIHRRDGLSTACVDIALFHLWLCI